MVRHDAVRGITQSAWNPAQENEHAPPAADGPSEFDHRITAQKPCAIRLPQENHRGVVRAGMTSQAETGRHPAAQRSKENMLLSVRPANPPRPSRAKSTIGIDEQHPAHEPSVIPIRKDRQIRAIHFFLRSVAKS